MGQSFTSRFRRSSSLSVILSLVALSVAPARADEPPADASKIEKVTVTAQKRNQDSQDVPAAVSTIGGQQAKDLGVNTTDKLAEFVPDVSIGMPSGQGNQPIVTIRGVGNNDFNTNNAGPNGIYSDDVYLSSPSSQTFQTFDLQRIEVLRGPQGTLYGRNTSSGLINYITNKPIDEFSAGLWASYGSYDAEEEWGFLNLPTSDDSAGRIAFIRDSSEGFMKNLLTGDHVSGTDSFAARAQWAVHPSENFSLLFNLHGGAVDTLPTEYHQVGTSQGAFSFTPCLPADIKAHLCTDTFGYSGPANIYDGNYNRTQHLNVKNEGVSVHADYDIGNVTLTSITAFEHNTKLHPEDSDASPLRMLEIDYGVRSNTFTQELRAAGSGDKYNWLVGLYYLNETLKQNQTINIFLDADIACGFSGCGDNPVPGDPTFAFAQIGKGISDQKTRSYALFSQGDYEIFDRTHLTLGGRYTIEDRDFNVVGLWTDQVGGMDNFEPFQQLWAFDESIEDKGFSWRVALDHRFDETVMAYASIATGFKSGGFNGGFLDVNPANAADQAAPVRPERNLAYEVGVKSDLLDKRLRLNLAGFWYDYKDLQVLNLVNTSTAFELQILDNAPKATIKGIEFEGIAKPFENFTLTANATWLDAKIDEFASGAVDFSGNTLPLAPKFSMSAIADYKIPLGGGDSIDLIGSASYKSKVFFDLANNPLITQDGFWLLDARATYLINNGDWAISVYGRNLGDEKYDNFAFDLTQTFGFLEQIVGPPLTVGAEVSFRYN